MSPTRLFLYCLAVLLTFPSVARGFSDDFETDQQWGIFEEIVGGSACYGDGVGEVARSTDVAFAGSNSLRVWANKALSLKSNHVIAQKRLSFAGRTGIWRYELQAYISPETGNDGEAGPEFSMQNTRERTTGVFLTATAGIQYQANPFGSQGNWAVWREQTPGVAGWHVFTHQLLEPGRWYSIAVEADFTINQYVRFSVKGEGVDLSVDLSTFNIALEDKDFPEEAFWLTLESENLFNNCGTAGAFDYRVYYDDIKLVELDVECDLPPGDLADIGVLADWVKSLQYTNPDFTSEGAIKIHHTVGFREGASVRHQSLSFAPFGSPNRHWSELRRMASSASASATAEYFRVVPYNSNLAVLGLLRAPVPGKLEVAERWINWYLGHLNPSATPPGIVYDHWYLADGSGETTCPDGIPPELCDHDDASDSYAATLLGVAWAYYEEGGSLDFLNAPGNKAKFETIAGVILALQQAEDGLTWATNGYRVKFLLDNSEVFWGLRSMALLEAQVFGDAAAAATYDNAADRVRDGILQYLVNPSTSLYRWARYEDGSFEEADLNVWYPDAVAQVWPHLFGVTASTSATAQAHMAVLNDNWDGVPNPDWTTTAVGPGGFLWPSVGHAALLAGDRERARVHADFVKDQKFPGFDFPWTADDAGFLLRTLSIVKCPDVRVSGAVRSDCRPLGGVTVELDHPAGLMFTTLTDDDGNYVFQDVPQSVLEGVISIVIPQGYAAVSPEGGEDLVSLEVDQVIDFTLQCLERQTWYVDGTQSPGVGDGSLENPWRTIREAMEARSGNDLVVEEGDEVLITPGIYAEQLLFNGGVPRPGGDPNFHPKAPNNYVTFRSSVAGEKVILNGASFVPRGVCEDPTNPSQWMGVVFQLGIKGIKLEDFEIINWDHYGLNVTQADDITLSRLSIHDNGIGIWMDPNAYLGDAFAKNVHLHDSKIYDNTCSGMTIGGTGHSIGPNNEIYRNGDDPAGKGWGIQMSPSIANAVDIHHNDIFANGHGIRIGGGQAVEGNHFHNNTVTDNQLGGVEIEENGGRNSIVDNTIKRNGGYGVTYFGVSDIGGLEANTVQGNTIEAGLANALAVAAYLEREDFDWQVGEVFDNNSYAQTNAQFLMQTPTSSQHLSFGQWQIETGQDPNSTIADVVETPAGGTGLVAAVGGVTLEFDAVTSGGTTTFKYTGSGPTLPNNFALATSIYYHITTTAEYAGNIRICIEYQESHLNVDESELLLLHYDPTAESWGDVTSAIDTEANVICGVTTNLSPFVLAHLLPPISVSGTVSADVSSGCGGALEGVAVDLLVDSPGGYLLTTVTDENGAYSFVDVSSASGTGEISIVVPLGYSPVLPASGDAVIALDSDQTQDFSLICLEASGEVRSKGYWKHQVNVYSSDREGAEETKEDMETNFPLAIFNHFHQNELNSIQVEDVTYVVVSGDVHAAIDLEVMQAVFSAKKAAMLDRAKQHYLALLLNIASAKLNTFDVVSDDGRTASQALQFVAALILDGDSSTDELAKDIADAINNGQLVGADVILPTYQNIAYVPRAGVAFSVSPNPAAGGRQVFGFTNYVRSKVTLRVYDLAGRQVAMPFRGELEPGRHRVSWNGRSSSGRLLAAGMYFARLVSSAGVTSLKVLRTSR